jgi:hypothetical protein
LLLFVFVLICLFFFTPNNFVPFVFI